MLVYNRSYASVLPKARCIATKEGVFFEIPWSTTVFGRYLLFALLMTKLVLRPFLLRQSCQKLMDAHIFYYE